MGVMIDAAVIRRKVHQQIVRHREETRSDWGKGYLEALANVESLIDRMTAAANAGRDDDRAERCKA